MTPTLPSDENPDTRLHSIVLFFILAFALTWGTSYVLGRTVGGATTTLAFILSFLPAFGPFFAAMIVYSLTEGSTGLHHLFSQFIKFRVQIKWYLFAFFIPILVYFTQRTIGALFHSPISNPFLNINWDAINLLFIINLFVGGGIAEEPGWRGYATPKLDAKYGPMITSIVVGIGWAFWHFPLYLNGSRPLSSFYQFLIAVIALSFIYTWLYINTQSLPIVIIFHFMHNIALALFYDISSPIFGGLIYSVVAVVLIIIYGSGLKKS